MSFDEEKNFTREELVHALRSCATMGAECEQCEFYEADTPRGYSPCHESLLLTKAANFIESIPSAEPERKKGEWIYDGKRGRFPACKCSICGHYENADWALSQGVNYCPNCGAEMSGE